MAYERRIKNSLISAEIEQYTFGEREAKVNNKTDKNYHFKYSNIVNKAVLLFRRQPKQGEKCLLESGARISH